MSRRFGRVDATVGDVAARAGVSKTTAAYILRDAPNFSATEATRRRVWEASVELGYRRNAVAASLSSGRTQAVGILLPLQHIQAGTSIQRTYGQDVFLAVFKAASRANLHIIPVPLPQQPNAAPALEDVMDRRVDGLVLASLNDAAFIRGLEEAGVPFVEIGSGTSPYLAHPDNEGGAEAAVAHLTALGHRRIAHLRGDIGAYASDHRCAGFLASAARYPVEDAPVVSNLEAMRTLLRRPAGERPTAVFTFNDNVALQVSDIARSIGLRVPEDLSLVGFDDNVIAEAARPALTSIHNPLDEQADAAIALLQRRWHGEPLITSPPAIPTRLVVRESTTQFTP